MRSEKRNLNQNLRGTPCHSVVKFLLCALVLLCGIFTGCVLWDDIETLRKQAMKNGGHCIECYEIPCVCKDDCQHEFGNWIVTTSPTCVAAGEETRTCTVNGCNETEKQAVAINPDAHNWETKSGTPATCTEPSEETRECKLCSKTETNPIEALGHDWGNWTETIAPTETEGGEEIRYCLHEGCYEFETHKTPATGGEGHVHEWSNWIVTTSPTCVAVGVETRVCLHDSTHFETNPITALGHNFSSWNETTPATCTTSGLQTRTCTRNGCNETETNPIAASGHNFSNWIVTTSPTCVAAGEETRTCTVNGCNETEKQAVAINPDAHNWETKSGTPATCTEPGGGARECKLCSKTETSEYFPPVGHDSGQWHTIQDASCTTGGLKELRCTKCDEVLDTDTIAAPGHNWGDWAVTKDPTATTEGEQTRTCSVCSELDTEVIPVTGALTLAVSDFDISGLTTYTYDGSDKTAAITTKAGKSSGSISVYYNGADTLPRAAGTYIVTFDVSAANGWNAAAGLDAGTLTITPRQISITGVSAADRLYDNTETVTLTGGTLAGIVTGDTVGFSLGTGTISDANPGNNKPVTVNIQLTGSDSGNYVLLQPGDITVNIKAQESFSITFDDFLDINAPAISADVIHLFGGAERPTTSNLTVTNPQQYDSGSIRWYNNRTVINDGVSGSFGEMLTVNSASINFNKVGLYLITVEVKIDGKLYNKAVLIEVKP